ncbi:hypothetical protein EJ03DRAFT_331106 [Teratosphaeria nubilosa]|uniref:Uncharacterized protein n=1 Tax=Teratosphaeria nubilosa TaxID=161662 RepID=A0A6G1KY89_9PEZI|nr:hypothetical protein EJ03DRAFT_331106 [Teratosphaeria nubilosa]
MLFHDRFTLPSGDQLNVHVAWFDKQKQRPVHKDDSTLRGWLAEEVDALQAFRDGQTDVDATASAMTRPISTSSVPAMGGYSDDIVALNTLWQVIIAALVEWPDTRTPDLFALLGAIAKLPSKIHQGEATDDDDKPCTWAGFPYFALNWPGDVQPGQICRQCPDEASLASARRLYLRVKDLEARLVAKNVIGMSKQTIQSIIRALEKNIDDSDQQLAPDEATAYYQVKLDFHIPAMSFMFRYNGQAIYDQVVRDGLKHWTPRQMPEEARAFEDGAARWSFWKQRLGQLAQGGGDDEVKMAAEATLDSMALCS